VRIMLINASFNRIPIDDNKGAESIICSTIEVLRKFLPDTDNIEISTPIVFSKNFHPESYNLHPLRKRPLSPFRHVTFWSCSALLLKLSRVYLWRFLKGRLGVNFSILLSNPVIKAFANCNLVIHLGMDQYTDKAGLLHFFSHSSEILIGLLLNKPVVMLAETLGPFNSSTAKRLAKSLLNKVSLITLREQESLQRLQHLEVTKPPVHLTACPAFLLSPASEERTKDILVQEGIDRKEDNIVIGYNPSVTSATLMRGEEIKVPLKSFFVGLECLVPEWLLKLMLPLARFSLVSGDVNKAHNEYAETAAQIISSLLEQIPNAEVWLIPYIYTPNPLASDIATTNAIFNSINDDVRKRVRLFKGSYTAPEVKGIIKQCDLFIGEKLHACIASLSQSIPTIGVGYHFKVRAVFQMLGLEEFVVPSFTADTVVAIAKRAFSKQEAIRNEFNSRLPHMKELAYHNGKLIQELVESSKRH